MIFVKLYGPRGGRIHLDVNEGHFYRYRHATLRCVDSQFFATPDITTVKCNVKPGEKHQHPIPSRESVEQTVFRWACKLRVVNCCQTENLVSQSIKFVVSTWPQPHSVILSVINPTFEAGLKRYRDRTLENHPNIREFLEEFGDKTFDRFYIAFNTLPFWTQPVPVIREGIYFIWSLTDLY